MAEAKLANQTALYAAGKVSAHILGTVQAETISERLNREQALADLVKAAVDLQAAAGVLLSRLDQDVTDDEKEKEEVKR